MRNLKKILALVLALVMSLSLMATAGATDWTDADEISGDYATAIDVLNALKVFQGYEDGTFQPKGALTRAEAAVLVYRIATGDAEGKYVDNYTYMQNSKFQDLTGYGWAAGYINYCQNAEIVIGTSATTFSPGLKVTGYQLMVMALRTLGYDRAGEFSDPITWELESARKCEQLRMLDNIKGTGNFGEPATREMTAEILFQTLLQHTVDYSINTPGGYTQKATTLGYDKFGLEEVTGVVMANEYADLRYDDEDSTVGAKTLAADTTVLRDSDGKDRTITIKSYLTDLGESRTAYTVLSTDTKRAYDNLVGVVLAPTVDSKGNAVNEIAYDGGDAKTSLSSYISGSDADHYINFARNLNNDTTNIKVSYRIDKITQTFTALTKENAIKEFRNTYHLSSTNVVEATGHLVVSGSTSTGKWEITYTPKTGDIDGNNSAKTIYTDKNGHTYSIRVDNGVPYYYVEIAPGSKFTSEDADIVESIFNKADKVGADVTDPANGPIVIGEVYRGTQSLRDYSDNYSYVTFS